MPKLYEYFGLIIMFYANEHEPVHVHGKCQGREAKAEIILTDGQIDSIRYLQVTGREMLTERELQYFREIVSARAVEIVQKWIDYFVWHKSIHSERIYRRLK